ncbi:MAG: MDR family MFS transporter [Anaerolineales bacterium]|jgi:EmrB/QacA subfamily drug resistance transporter
MADVPHTWEKKEEREGEDKRNKENESANVQTTNRITGSRRWWALAAVLITIFFGSLDQTVVSTAMPVIVGDLKGFDIYAWVFTAYLMTSTITVPIYGKLSDVYGRKPFYIFGLSVFIVGSALSGQSHSMIELIIFRGLQGIGAGAMLSMPRATIGDIFTPRERGRWMGVISMTFGLSSIIGPYLGGWITDQFGWQWIFYINLPVAFLALLGTLYALPRVRAEKDVQVDWTGSALLVAGLVPLLLAFTWAGNQYAWGSAQIIGLFAFSVGMLALFAWVETRVAEPIIPTDFFKVPIFTTANLVGFLISIGMFGTLLFLPLYVQGVLGFSAQNSGAIMTPMMGSFIVAALVAGQIMTRSGKYKMISVSAAIIMSGGLYLFTRLGANSNYTSVIIDMVVLGIGIGALLPVLNVAVQNAFPYRDMGIVNAAQQFVRSLGAVIATPILGTVLANEFSAQMKVNLPATLQQAMNNLPPAVQKVLSDPQSLTNAQTQAAIKSKFDVFGANGIQLYHQFINAVHQSLAAGIQQLFWIALFFGLAALLATLFLPEIRLQQEEFFEDGKEIAQPDSETRSSS